MPDCLLGLSLRKEDTFFGHFCVDGLRAFATLCAKATVLKEVFHFNFLVCVDKVLYGLIQLRFLKSVANAYIGYSTSPCKVWFSCRRVIRYGF